MLGALRRRAAHNGLELSCPAAQATPPSFSRIPAGKSRSNFPHASRVSCSELLAGAKRCPAWVASSAVAVLNPEAGRTRGCGTGPRAQ